MTCRHYYARQVEHSPQASVGGKAGVWGQNGALGVEGVKHDKEMST